LIIGVRRDVSDRKEGIDDADGCAERRGGVFSLPESDADAIVKREMPRNDRWMPISSDQIHGSMVDLILIINSLIVDDLLIPRDSRLSTFSISS
jgi:hypothetical protein